MTETPERVGPWKLGSEIGFGGQGRVFEAWKEEGAEAVALKLIRTSHPKKRERFRKEMEIHATLSARKASNVISVIDCKIEDLPDGGVQGYIVMPRARGTLEDFSSTFRNRVELCLEVFHGITVGIGQAHQEGAIHRDIKPRNVLFLDESLKEPMVSDFGICFLRDTTEEKRITEAGETVGARFFMAPEQEEGGPIDVQETADIYALGKLLHFMITGRFLNREQLEKAFEQDEISSDPRLKLIHERILSRTILKEPKLRIQSAKDLLSAIVEVQDSLGTSPRNSETPAPSRNSQSSRHSASVSPASESDEATSRTKLERYYQKMAKQLAGGKVKLVALVFDDCQRAFSAEWNKLYPEIKDNPQNAESAAHRLILAQPRAIAAALAMARLDEADVFSDFRRLLEFVTESTETMQGYPEILGIPHVLSGFLYMASATMAVGYESWNVLNKLMTGHFALYDRGGGPVYEYGFEHHHFFHSASLKGTSSKTHDLFRAELSKGIISSATGFSSERIVNVYLQTQMLMCLRAAQLCIQGEEASIFADFGRFYDSRVRPLLDRMYADPAYADGICRAFGETREQFFDSLNKRLGLIRRTFFTGSPFHWVSISSWQPR